MVPTMYKDYSSANAITFPENPNDNAVVGVPQVVRPITETVVEPKQPHPSEFVAYRLDWLLIMFVSFVVVVVAISGVRLKKP